MKQTPPIIFLVKLPFFTSNSTKIQFQTKPVLSCCVLFHFWLNQSLQQCCKLSENSLMLPLESHFYQFNAIYSSKYCEPTRSLGHSTALELSSGTFLSQYYCLLCVNGVFSLSRFFLGGLHIINLLAEIIIISPSSPPPPHATSCIVCRVL